MKKIFAGLFFCLLAGLIYFFIWSPVLWIQKIDVRPLRSNISAIVQNNLEKKIWRFIPQKSIILAPIDKIKEDILDNFPEIKEVIINKKATNLLIIEIIERQSIGIWCQTERLKIEATSTEPIINEPVVKQCFCLDKEGIIFRESPLISGSLILNIFDIKKESVILGEEVSASNDRCGHRGKADSSQSPHCLPVRTPRFWYGGANQPKTAPTPVHPGSRLAAPGGGRRWRIASAKPRRLSPVAGA